MNQNQPLICMGITKTTPANNGVTVTTTRKPSGSWETVAFVNGKFYSSCSSKDRQYNIDAVKEDLSEMGYEMPEPAKVPAPKRIMLIGKLRQVVGFLKG